MNKTYYIGIYVSDDPRSIKICEHRAVFGEEINSEEEKDSRFSWKYVNLECPVCNFIHQFKREIWFEEMKLD